MCLLRNKHFVWLYVSGIEKPFEGIHPYGYSGTRLVVDYCGSNRLRSVCSMDFGTLCIVAPLCELVCAEDGHWVRNFTVSYSRASLSSVALGDL
jgi:hypothetical protein